MKIIFAADSFKGSLRMLHYQKVLSDYAGKDISAVEGLGAAGRYGRRDDARQRKPS